MQRSFPTNTPPPPPPNLVQKKRVGLRKRGNDLSKVEKHFWASRPSCPLHPVSHNTVALISPASEDRTGLSGGPRVHFTHPPTFYYEERGERTCPCRLLKVSELESNTSVGVPGRARKVGGGTGPREGNSTPSTGILEKLAGPQIFCPFPSPQTSAPSDTLLKKQVPEEGNPQSKSAQEDWFTTSPMVNKQAGYYYGPTSNLI